MNRERFSVEMALFCLFFFMPSTTIIIYWIISIYGNYNHSVMSHMGVRVHYSTKDVVKYFFSEFSRQELPSF